MSEIFNDPELKQKAKEFAESAAESAKAFGSRFNDEDVKDKFNPETVVKMGEHIFMVWRNV